MSQAVCAHCGVAITDRSSVVEAGGKTYCCGNCAQMEDDSSFRAAASGVCAHCGATISDPSGGVERDDMKFCCNNCAAAMATGEQATGPTY